MFSNGRKTIGLFIFNTHGDFQGQICQGMAERARELGYNLAVFASYGGYGENLLYHDGEVEIFGLPDYEKLAGVVVALDTTNIERIKKQTTQKIMSQISCPVVSLRESMIGANNILIDEAHAMDDIVRHVIEKHGKKDIAFMTGVKGRYDAEQRLKSFLRVMKEYDYPVDEHRIFYGDFWTGKAKEACDWFSADGKYPEAIICANDKMALAVIDELYERGLEVPADIIVTGFDNLEEGAVNSPSLTTVDVGFIGMAHKAVDLIDKHQNDCATENVFVKTHIVERNSCGCADGAQYEKNFRRCVIHKNMIKKENLEMQFSFMTVDFSNMDRLEKLHEVVDRYIYNIEGFKNYYLCLRDDIEEGKDTLLGYSDTMHVRVGFKDRVDMGQIDIPFQRTQLLPAEVTGKEPQCYFFFPLHFLDKTFGYEVYNFMEHMGSESYVRWNIAISNAIENILKQKQMNDLISELENMYVQDVLTGLYNRRGFEKYGRMQFSKARAKDSMICVIGIDMDGLKPINDIYGHHEGDSALRAVGYAIQEAAIPGQIGARVGGDEFEVIFPCSSEDEVKKWCEAFEQSLENFNKKSIKPYNVYASLGYKCGVPTINDTIASYMHESDDIMYRNKVRNKRRRNEELR